MTTLPYVATAQEGEAFWFTGSLMVLLASGEQTDGRFALLDQYLPGDYAAPSHIHQHDDEAWYVLDGEATFTCGDQQLQAARGAWVFLPKGIPHAFRVGADGAHLLVFNAPAGFEQFVRAAGQPAATRTIPPAEPLDLEVLARLAAEHGIQIVGPPPA
jgi:quercetin dioxygenase-like cupin family protein